MAGHATQRALQQRLQKSAKQQFLEHGTQHHREERHQQQRAASGNQAFDRRGNRRRAQDHAQYGESDGQGRSAENAPPLSPLRHHPAHRLPKRPPIPEGDHHVQRAHQQRVNRALERQRPHRIVRKRARRQGPPESNQQRAHQPGGKNRAQEQRQILEAPESAAVAGGCHSLNSMHVFSSILLARPPAAGS